MYKISCKTRILHIGCSNIYLKFGYAYSRQLEINSNVIFYARFRSMILLPMNLAFGKQMINLQSILMLTLLMLSDS